MGFLWIEQAAEPFGSAGLRKSWLFYGQAYRALKLSNVRVRVSHQRLLMFSSPPSPPPSPLLSVASLCAYRYSGYFFVFCFALFVTPSVVVLLFVFCIVSV
jgi:hypothetical protein